MMTNLKYSAQVFNVDLIKLQLMDPPFAFQGDSLSIIRRHNPTEVLCDYYRLAALYVYKLADSRMREIRLALMTIVTPSVFEV